LRSVLQARVAADAVDFGPVARGRPQLQRCRLIRLELIAHVVEIDVAAACRDLARAFDEFALVLEQRQTGLFGLDRAGHDLALAQRARSCASTPTGRSASERSTKKAPDSPAPPR